MSAAFGRIETFIRWVPDDGIGRGVHDGLNRTERGLGTPVR